MSLFKECVSMFATGVTVVTTKDVQGIAINSFCSLSLEPTMILFNLEKAATRFEVFHNCTEFVVNILSKGQQEISKAFAEVNAKKWQHYLHTSDELPVVKGALCYIHCLKHQVYDGGDHKIIIGLVHNMQKKSEDGPLIYYKGNYCELKDE